MTTKKKQPVKKQEDLGTEAQFRMSGICHLVGCVPEKWSDEEILAAAGDSGTSGGWSVRQEDDGSSRVKCGGREGFVHVVLVC